jgi:hypothetical protein
LVKYFSTGSFPKRKLAILQTPYKQEPQIIYLTSELSRAANALDKFIGRGTTLRASLVAWYSSFNFAYGEEGGTTSFDHVIATPNKLPEVKPH